MTRPSAKTLSREELKLITRRRLLEAAARLIGEVGYGGLSASAIAREAGIAQPTFYVHFRDKDELVRALGEEKIGALRSKLRDARERLKLGEGVSAIRETFRLPLEAYLANPAFFRLYAQEVRHPGSPLGEQARALGADLRRDLAEDLARLGFPSATDEEKEKLDMIAASMIAQTEALALAHLDGRYANLEAVVDVLTGFAVGLFGVYVR